MKKIIGYLMNLANREGKKDVWYSLKEKLCRRYGVNNGYDVQFLEGKKCHSCDGTGLFTKYSFGSTYKEPCFRCANGWFKQPCYVLLERIKVGNYVFHKPTKRTYKQSEIADLPASVTITGYINYSKAKYGWLAFSILYILFDFKGYRRHVNGMGYGWRCSWWLPQNYLYNFMHLKRNGWDAIPMDKIRMKFRRLKRIFHKESIDPDSLPF